MLVCLSESMQVTTSTMDLAVRSIFRNRVKVQMSVNGLDLQIWERSGPIKDVASSSPTSSSIEWCGWKTNQRPKLPLERSCASLVSRSRDSILRNSSCRSWTSDRFIWRSSTSTMGENSKKTHHSTTFSCQTSKDLDVSKRCCIEDRRLCKDWIYLGRSFGTSKSFDEGKKILCEQHESRIGKTFLIMWTLNLLVLWSMNKLRISELLGKNWELKSQNKGDCGWTGLLVEMNMKIELA